MIPSCGSVHCHHRTLTLTREGDAAAAAAAAADDDDDEANYMATGVV